MCPGVGLESFYGWVVYQAESSKSWTRKLCASPVLFDTTNESPLASCCGQIPLYGAYKEESELTGSLLKTH